MSLTALMSHYGDSDVDSDEDFKRNDSLSKSSDDIPKDEQGSVDSSDEVSENISEENDNIDDKIVDITVNDDKNKDLEDNNQNNNDGSDVEEMEVDDSTSKPAKPVKRYSCDSALAFAKKIQNLHNEDEIELPPEPEGSCSPALQDKIKILYEQKIRGGGNLIYAIQSRKDFRNPSIYEKFLLLLGIEERGTNFPKSDYDPEYWRKQPSYADLSRSQREDMAKREKEKKTKVEFVTGTAKKPSSRPGSSEPPKRTKWDKPALSAAVNIAAQKNISSGISSTTKSIPAVGDLKSRSLSKH